MIDYSLRSCVERNITVRCCKNCGRWFPQTGRVSAEYCERPVPKGQQRCRDIGALKQWTLRQAGNDAFKAYRKAIGDLIRFIVHTNYEVKMNIRRRPSKRFKTEKFYLIQVVDEKIDSLAADILSNHLETMQILVRIDEINGILVDLLT